MDTIGSEEKCKAKRPYDDSASDFQSHTVVVLNMEVTEAKATDKSKQPHISQTDDAKTGSKGKDSKADSKTNKNAIPPYVIWVQSKCKSFLRYCYTSIPSSLIVV